ncbi:MAG: hypothetical protein ACRCY8_05595 [Dermatophilaceae bacterium]
MAAGVLVPVCLVAWWVVGTVADTDDFVAQVAPVVSTPEVGDLVAERAASRVDNPLLADLVGPLTRTVLDSPAFAPTVRSTIADSHRELRAGLESGTSAAVTREGELVVIRIGPLADALRERLEAEGVPAGVFPAELDATVPLTTTQRFERAGAAYRGAELAARWGPVALGVLVVVGALLLGRLAAAAARFGLVGLLGSVVVAVGAGPATSAVAGQVADGRTRAAAEVVLAALAGPLVTSAWVAAGGLAVIALLGALVRLRRRPR